MGPRSLESSLRLRLLLLIGPLLIALGVASLALTASVLGKMDRDAARTQAESALRVFDGERAEGDSEATAVREVLANADAQGTRLALLQTGYPPRVGHGALPYGLMELAPGTCLRVADEHGESWQGCAASRDSLVAIVALHTQLHTNALRWLALGMAVIVFLALLGAAIAVRFALAAPIASLNQLVMWSERVASSQGRLMPPTTDALELQRLTLAFEQLVQRLLAGLARERRTSAHMAHEFRTPLTAIRAELDAMPSEAGDAVTRVREDVARLSRVVESILVLSAPPAPPGTAVVQTVVNVADLVRSLTPTGTVIDAPDEALVDGDEHLLELALRNLLENAQRYSGHQATSVHVTRESDAIRVTVSDCGAGLIDSDFSKMFDAYWRGEHDQSALAAEVQPLTMRGVGLGLALVRAVAERHAGVASARKNPTGRGLEVGFTLGRVRGWQADPPA